MNVKTRKAIRRIRAKRPRKGDLDRAGRHWEREREQAALRPVLAEPRKRARAPLTGPSWPRTDDQRKQSRPLIVEHPLRHLKRLCGSRAYLELARIGNNRQALAYRISELEAM